MIYVKYHSLQDRVGKEKCLHFVICANISQNNVISSWTNLCQQSKFLISLLTNHSSVLHKSKTEDISLFKACYTQQSNLYLISRRKKDAIFI